MASDKIMRLHAEMATIENGFVQLPDEAPRLDLPWAARDVHAPKALGSCEILVRLARANVVDDSLGSKKVYRPVGPNLAEALSQDASRFSVIDHEVQVTRDSDCDGCRFTVSEAVSRRRSHNVEEQIEFRGFERNDRDRVHRAQRMVVGRQSCSSDRMPPHFCEHLFGSMARDSQRPEDCVNRLGRQ